MSEHNFVIKINDEEYLEEVKIGWFKPKIETTRYYISAFKFTKEEADALAETIFKKLKKSVEVVEITEKKTKYSQFYILDTYVGYKCVSRNLFGYVFNMHGRYAIELNKGKRLTIDTNYTILSETDDPVFFLRFKDKEEAQKFLEPALIGSENGNIIEVPEIDEEIKNSFGFKRLEAESNFELDEMLDRYISGGWKLQGDRIDDFYKYSQIIVKEKK